MDDQNIHEIQYPRPVTPTLPSKELMRAILREPVPSETVAIWHLGQNGFILRDKTGPVITIDPYLTDFCASGYTGEKTGKSRFLPIFLEPEDLKTNLLLLTHSHCDHADPYTLRRISCKENVTVIAPWAAAKVARDSGFPESSVLLAHPGQRFDIGELQITVTFSLPTDATDLGHVGYYIRFPGGKSFWNTGDTAVSPLVASSVPGPVDLMTVCINGGYNNLSFFQAAELVKQVKPRLASPTHFDTMPHNFQPPGLFLSAVSRMSPETTPVIISYGKPFLF